MASYVVQSTINSKRGSFGQKISDQIKVNEDCNKKIIIIIIIMVADIQKQMGGGAGELMHQRAQCPLAKKQRRS